MIWHPRSMIEPSLPLTPAQRRSVMREAWQQWIHQPRNSLSYGLAISAAVVLNLFLPDWIDLLLNGHRWWHTLLAFAIYLAVLVGLIWMLLAHSFAPCVRLVLRARGFDICPECGYWLRDLGPEISNCPECGSRRSPEMDDS